jgi:hypothetical protein
MKKDAYGVWEIRISPISPGVCAIPHDSKIKVVQVLKGLSLVMLSSSLDLNGSSVGTTNRTPPCLD